MFAEFMAFESPVTSLLGAAGTGTAMPLTTISAPTVNVPVTTAAA